MLRRTYDGTNTVLTVFAFGVEEHAYSYSGSGSSDTNTSNTYYREDISCSEQTLGIVRKTPIGLMHRLCLLERNTYEGEAKKNGPSPTKRD